MTLPGQFLRGRSLGEHVRALELLPLLVEKVLVRDILGHRSQVSRVKLECPGKLWFGIKAAFSVMMSSVVRTPAPAQPPAPASAHPLDSHSQSMATGTSLPQGYALHSGACRQLGNCTSLLESLKPIGSFWHQKAYPPPMLPFPRLKHLASLLGAKSEIA